MLKSFSVTYLETRRGNVQVMMPTDSRTEIKKSDFDDEKRAVVVEEILRRRKASEEQ